MSSRTLGIADAALWMSSAAISAAYGPQSFVLVGITLALRIVFDVLSTRHRWALVLMTAVRAIGVGVELNQVFRRGVLHLVPAVGYLVLTIVGLRLLRDQPPVRPGSN